MLKILICTGLGEPKFSSNKGLIYAFQQLGIETWVIGPQYWDRGEEEANVLLCDKPFPETWDYREILALCPWTPDFVFQIAPHFWLTGEKPKGIRSGYYSTDAHCEGLMYKRAAIHGQFDYLFLSPPSYLHFFRDLAPNVHTILPAFDERRFSKDINLEPECDIAFVGQNGLRLDFRAPHIEQFIKQDEVGRYIDNVHKILPDTLNKYSGNAPSYDYAERGELLYRLSKDFNVRLYEPLWDTRLQLAIQKGRIGFNCSLLDDLPIRVWENFASARIPVTDCNWGIEADMESVAGHEWIYAEIYPAPCYRPFYQNFSLAYEQVKIIVSDTLEKPNLLEWQQRAQDWAFEHSTWSNRARQILELIGV